MTDVVGAPDDEAYPLEIDPAALRALRDEGGDFQLLDIREDWERRICMLSDSIEIPMTTLPGNLAALTPDRPLVVLCHHGVRSLQATRWLRRQGYGEATSLRGGIDAWSLEIDGAIPRY